LKSSIATALCSSFAAHSAGLGISSRDHSLLSKALIGYQGQMRVGSSGLYSFGNGTRIYSPRLARFSQLDSLRYSPFGNGGVNGYMLNSADVINLRDPSGNAAIFSILIGTIIGTVIGASVSATSEGIKKAVSGSSFNWRNFAVSTVLGGLSGLFGAAASIAPLKIKSALSVADTIVSAGVEFGIDVALDDLNFKDAGISAAKGAVIGLISFGTGTVGGRTVHKTVANVKNRRARYVALQAINRKNYLRNRGSRPMDRPLFDEQVSKGFIKVHDIPKGSEYLISNLAKNSTGDRFIFAYSEKQGVRIVEQLKHSGKGFNPEAFHHQNIFRFSQDILSIGEMFFENEIPHFFANSGHYLPPIHSLSHVKNFFNKAGINVVIPDWDYSVV